MYNVEYDASTIIKQQQLLRIDNKDKTGIMCKNGDCEIAGKENAGLKNDQRNRLSDMTISVRHDEEHTV